MKYPHHTIIIFLLVLTSCFHVSAQDSGQAIRIENPDTDTIFYCGNPIAVAPNIIIENFDPQKPSDGIKISIVNYVAGEDILRYSGAGEPGVVTVWNEALGNLEITGLKTAGELQEAIRQVYYENTSGTPVTDFRSISISMMDADYLPETGHFYRYVSSPDITWTEAKAAAEGMTYHDLTGYLATITSSAENNFIWTKIDGMGWIGATDEGNEGNWRWATGPEAGTAFWQGDASGMPVEGRYSHWSEGEPNNDFGNEHYAHINQDPNKADTTWNDLPNEGGGGVYRSQGYIVEFGTPDDTLYKLSTSAIIGVNQVPEFFIDAYDTLICGERQQQLSIQVDQKISTVLRPLDENAVVRDSATLNPIVEVLEFGRYQFELEIFNEEQCSWFETISISFQHQPVAGIDLVDSTCVAYDLGLSFAGEVQGDALYQWYSNNTLYESGINLDSLVISLEKGISERTVGLKVIENSCADSIHIPVTVKPIVEIEAQPMEGCTPLNVQFGFTATENIDAQFWKIGPDSSSIAENPSFIFLNSGDDMLSHNVTLNVISAEGCESGDTIENMIRVHPLPKVDMNFEESICYEGNEEIWYRGNAGSRDTFLWNLSSIPPGDVVQDPGTSEGPLQLNLTGSPVADIGLQVISEFGCKSDTLVRTFKRNPSFIIPPDTVGGCPPFEVELSVSTSDLTDKVNYLWDFGNGQSAGGSIVSQEFSGENQYFDVSVYAVSSLTGCADTVLIPGKIYVFPVPEASFTADPASVLITDPEIRFENTSHGASRYEWDFGDRSLGSTLENPSHRYEQLGFFDVQLFAENQFGCADSASSQISVSFDKLFPPTAFSPNASREEDREFRIYADGIVNDGYKLLIFNRWGEVVFTSYTPEEGWNGKMKNGSNAPAGTYFWILEYLDLIGKEHTQNGSLTLLY